MTVTPAVLCEEVARTARLARQVGTPLPLDRSDTDHLYDRRQHVYGQAADHREN